MTTIMANCETPPITKNVSVLFWSTLTPSEASTCNTSVVIFLFAFYSDIQFATTLVKKFHFRL